MFRKKLGLDWACNLNDILTKDHPYINYEEKLFNKELKKV